ncbi:hypothetical protein [Roseivivax sp. THAF30]|uniref:hypothetical protein n=1 Tax=Roseivivax sp. THAF30 TaxID=2587852 RepID=UPI0012679971|nr:hypothetical protein [Roseivivax sp. THAF30]QFT64478.1 hypothetical protein FIU91_16185 [Roseivivax sp. THAF30]
MKRFMTATALTFAMAGTAFAATEAERVQIQSYLPNADVSGWSDTEVATAMNIINSNDRRSDIVGQLNALYDGEDYVSTPATITEAEMALLDQYVDGVDYSMMPQARVDAAISAAQSGMSESDKSSEIVALLSDDATPMSDMNSASAGEIALIRQYAPDADVSTLSDQQVQSVLAIIYSSENAGDVRGDVEAYLN